MQLFSAELGKGVEKYLKTCKEEGGMPIQACPRGYTL